MLPCRKNSDGVLYVTTTVPPNPFSMGGLVLGEQGVLYVTDTLLPELFVNGFGARHDGRLCVAFGGAIDFFSQGLPFTNDGRLVCQLNQTPADTDPFVGGIRVGQLGGVYVDDVSPPVEEAFSSGFSGGFS